MSNREWHNIIMYQIGYSSQPLSVEGLMRRIFPGGMKRRVRAEWIERLRMHCILLERRGWIQSVEPRPLVPRRLSWWIASFFGVPLPSRLQERYGRFVATDKLRFRLNPTMAPSPLQAAGVPVAAVLLAQACATQAVNVQAPQLNGLEHYHTLPRRAPFVAVEQFPAGDGGGVYRMCTTDCPRPTSKTVGRATQNAPAYGMDLTDRSPAPVMQAKSAESLAVPPPVQAPQSEATAAPQAPIAAWQKSLSSATSQSLAERERKPHVPNTGAKPAARVGEQVTPRAQGLPPPPLQAKPLPTSAVPVSAVAAQGAVGNVASGLLEGRSASSATQPLVAADDLASREPRMALLAWAEAWSARTPDVYFEMYAREFKPQNGWAFKDWKDARGRAMQVAGFVDIKVEPIRVTSDGSRATVRAWQTYRSPRFKSRVLKDFTMVREHGVWKILREAVLASASDSVAERSIAG